MSTSWAATKFAGLSPIKPEPEIRIVSPFAPDCDATLMTSLPSLEKLSPVKIGRTVVAVKIAVRKAVATCSAV